MADAAGPWQAIAASLIRLDERSVDGLNALTAGHAPTRRAASAAAEWLATFEVLLMLLLRAKGNREAVARMLIGVSTVYVATEIVGQLWRRDRPFARQDGVRELITHGPSRSFPSRHVASAFAMAAIAEQANTGVGWAMRLAAWLLAISRVAAGVHYPSDVLGGALLGALVGRWLR